MRAMITQPLVFSYLAFVSVLACVIGGSTLHGVVSNNILAITLIPALFIAAWNLKSTPVAPLVKLFAGLILVTLLLQFISLPSKVVLNAETGESVIALFRTQNSDIALQSSLYVICLMALAFSFATLTSSEKHLMAIIFLLCGALSLVIAFGQVSATVMRSSNAILPYPVRMGVFANPNHFATLIFGLIPIAAYLLIDRVKSNIAYIAVLAVTIIILLAVNSRSGTVLTPLVGLFAFALFNISNKKLLIATTAAAALLALFGAWISTENLLGIRAEFFKNTLSAAIDFLPFGSGLGSFSIIYPRYESEAQLGYFFVNHAHNDFLELFLELGIPALILMLLFLFLLLFAVIPNNFRIAAILSIATILVHSLIDYPLRNYAIGALFAFLCAVAFSQGDAKNERPTT